MNEARMDKLSSGTFKSYSGWVIKIWRNSSRRSMLRLDVTRNALSQSLWVMRQKLTSSLQKWSASTKVLNMEKPCLCRGVSRRSSTLTKSAMPPTSIVRSRRNHWDSKYLNSLRMKFCALLGTWVTTSALMELVAVCLCCRVLEIRVMTTVDTLSLKCL